MGHLAVVGAQAKGAPKVSVSVAWARRSLLGSAPVPPLVEGASGFYERQPGVPGAR